MEAECDGCGSIAEVLWNEEARQYLCQNCDDLWECEKETP